MDNSAKLDPRLLEAIEACRPGSQDPSDAELAALADGMASDPKLRAVYDKLKQTDVVLEEAFRDVPVPEGLTDRILSRLASAGDSNVRPEDPIIGHVSTIAPDSPAAEGGRFWRRGFWQRGWVLGTGSLALVGSLLIALTIWHGSEDVLTGGTVELAAVSLFDKEADTSPPGVLASEVSPPGSYPLAPPTVDQLPGIRWRWIDGFLERRGVAYDLAPAGGRRATLYVIKRTVPNLRSSPPSVPSFNSQNRCAAAWQSGGLLYVLVVDGDVGRYQEVLGMSNRPWA